VLFPTVSSQELSNILSCGARKGRRNVTDHKGWTPLQHIYHAGHDGTTELVRLFLDKGVEVEFGDDKGRTLLHFASQRGDVQVVRHLVENKGAAVDLRDNCGNASLHDACASGMVEVVRYLLRHHADANAENVYQYRPIRVSCDNLQLNVLKELVENSNAYIDAANTHGFTP
jgi:serine/threonine-protein phosphatase 6 regulatory ankyrin repeat subunit C